MSDDNISLHERAKKFVEAMPFNGWEIDVNELYECYIAGAREEGARAADRVRERAKDANMAGLLVTECWLRKLAAEIGEGS